MSHVAADHTSKAQHQLPAILQHKSDLEGQALKVTPTGIDHTSGQQRQQTAFRKHRLYLTDSNMNFESVNCASGRFCDGLPGIWVHQRNIAAFVGSVA